MFYYKKTRNDNIILYASVRPPKSLDGLTELTGAEYEELVALLNPDEEEVQENVSN